MTVLMLSSDRMPDVVRVLSDAFYDYPVMRYVLGPEPPYDDRLRTLVGLFVSGRVFRNDPLLGVDDEDGDLVATATMTLPGDPSPPPALLAHREAVWAELGREARARYEAFSSAAQQFAISAPHHHLNMIGVCRGHQGKGLSRRLLDAVHALAGADPRSTGVSLSTEHPRNLSLYAHFGYRVEGHARVADTLETWTLFRPVDYLSDGLSSNGVEV
jgi:GNAT superfamily N-acetyltransferase